MGLRDCWRGVQGFGKQDYLKNAPMKSDLFILMVILKKEISRGFTRSNINPLVAII